MKLKLPGAYQKRQDDNKLREEYGIDDPTVAIKVESRMVGFLKFVFDKIIKPLLRIALITIVVALASMGALALVYANIRGELFKVLGEIINYILSAIKSITGG